MQKQVQYKFKNHILSRNGQSTASLTIHYDERINM